jgi:hypothetical protein
VEELGKYQIRYDTRKNRFEVTWRILSLFSPDADFFAAGKAQDKNYDWFAY